MVNVDALKKRMEEKSVSYEDLSKLLNVPLWKTRRFILGSLDMDVVQAETIQNALEIKDPDFGYYFFDPRYSLRGIV
ncbi:MAG: hypothetical protein IJ192_01000 [Clostridia bacterium]|nr:hypothetical protein [Clostridia bacterium]